MGEGGFGAEDLVVSAEGKMREACEDVSNLMC